MTRAAGEGVPSARQRRRVRIALAGAVALLLLAIAAFYFASRQAHRMPEDGATVVRVLGDRCEPNALTVPAGRSTFHIVNASKRAVEWEILDGVMVVEERENIAPGFTQTLSVQLAPGQYQITCGLLSNPRGTLTVTRTDASDAARTTRPKLVEFVGALAEYRVFLATHADALVVDTQALVQAVVDGNMAAARQAYRSAYVHYALIEPAAGAYSDLAARMDGQAAYLKRRQNDPAYLGLRRINSALAQDAPAADLAPLTLALADDARALRERLLGSTLPPDRMAAGAARTMHQLLNASTDELDAGTQRARTQAALAGARKVFTLLEPFLARRDAALAASIAQAFDAASVSVEDASMRNAELLHRLADQLDRMVGVLGDG